MTCVVTEASLKAIPVGIAPKAIPESLDIRHTFDAHHAVKTARLWKTFFLISYPFMWCNGAHGLYGMLTSAPQRMDGLAFG